MLAFPPLFPTNYGWPSEDFIPNNIQLDCQDISIEVEANSYNSVLDIHTHHDLPPENSTSSGGLENCDFVTDPLLVVKKLNHNASERDRRKRVNDLYGYLRSLLPNSTDQKKKVSIPGTVSRALKYIPELQKEVETLIRKRENLSSSKYYSRQQQGLKKEIGKDANNETKSSSVVSSVRVLGAKEAVVQLISSIDDNTSKRKEIGFLSKVLEKLEHEEEEDGFVLINSTTFKCAGEVTSFSTLHLQVQGDNRIDAERLKEKLCSFDSNNN